MVAQTNHQTTKNAAENKWHSDFFTNRKNLTVKTLPEPYQVIFRSPLPKLHY